MLKSPTKGPPHFLTTTPTVHGTCWIAPGATVLGSVTLHEHASVWYQCVVRADINEIIIGPRSNIQDGSVIHLSRQYGCYVGCDVTVGHKAILHACKLDDEILVGMGAIIMDGVEIGPRCIIGAGSLITAGKKIPAGSLVYGNPAKVVRQLNLDEQTEIKGWATNYVELLPYYKNQSLPYAH
jgi:gamma-carbonic anhydrase